MYRLTACTYLLLSGIVLMSNNLDAAPSSKERALFSFQDQKSARAWKTVNDGVMGGVSEGRAQVTDNGALKFYGKLSLKNNGGFASVRCQPQDLELKSGDILSVRVRGDGRQYYLNLYLPTRRIAYSWRAAMQTKKGEWMEIKIPLKDFHATWFGRKLPNAGTVNASKVNAIGFMLSDKKEGPFNLEIDHVKVITAETEN